MVPSTEMWRPIHSTTEHPEARRAWEKRPANVTTSSA